MATEIGSPGPRVDEARTINCRSGSTPGPAFGVQARAFHAAVAAASVPMVPTLARVSHIDRRAREVASQLDAFCTLVLTPLRKGGEILRGRPNKITSSRAPNPLDPDRLFDNPEPAY